MGVAESTKWLVPGRVCPHILSLGNDVGMTLECTLVWVFSNKRGSWNQLALAARDSRNKLDQYQVIKQGRRHLMDGRNPFVISTPKKIN